MATLTVTKKYTSGDQWASLVFTLTYSVSNTDPVTSKLTCSSLKITTGQSTASTATQEQYLQVAKDERTNALANGVSYSVVYNGSTIANTTTHTTGSQSISTTARNVSKTHATQTKTLTLTGAGVSKSASISIPAKTSYKVTLNANGGTGGTASLTKWHGETLSLTSGFTAPTRTGYKFVGWGETSTATAMASQYTGNAAKTYYAVWEKQITGIFLNVTTLRVADGTSTAEADEGTWCYGTCTYSITGTAAADVVFTVSVTPNTPQITQDTFTATKTEDNTLTGSFEFWASGCATDASYTFMVAATATNTSAVQTVTKSQGNVLSMAYYVLDVLGDNYVDSGQRPAHGISFGAPCKDEGFHVAMPADFGTFPDKDPSTYALIIGNGTADNARSNAAVIDWLGNYIAQGWAGVIQMFGGSTPPAGWLLCDGSAVSRTTYATLFAAIGTTWGAGDGSTTFNLPDLRGRAPIGAGTGTGLSARSVGDFVGSEYLQAHTHAFTNPTITTHFTKQYGASGNARDLVRTGGTTTGNPSTATGGAVGAVTGVTTGNDGNMQPSAVVNFIIHTGKTS